MAFLWINIECTAPLILKKGILDTSLETADSLLSEEIFKKFLIVTLKNLFGIF